MNETTLPEYWKMLRLGEVATFTKKPRDLQYSEYDEVPFVPMDLIPIAKLFSEEFIPKTNDELSSGTYFESGDILLAKITPSFENGKQCIISDLPTPFGIATTEVIPIHEVEGVSDRFYLFYYLLLSNVRTLLAGRMQGTTGRQRLGKETLSNLEIPLPPLPEQRAIAHVLQTIQEAKFARQKEIALERERKAALMDFLFSHGTKGEIRKQTEIGKIPESWEVVRLSDVARIERGKFAHRPRNDPEFYGGEIPFIQTGDVTLSNGYIQTYTQTLNGRGLAVSKLFPKGTIVITIAANIGYTGILEFDCAFPDSLIGIFPCEGVIREYLNYFLMTQQPEMDRKASRGTQKNINIEFLRPWLIGIPSLPEQQEIAEILQAFDDKIAALEQEAERLEELFYAMLDELMTGQRSTTPLLESEMIQ